MDEAKEPPGERHAGPMRDCQVPSSGGIPEEWISGSQRSEH